MHNIYCFAIRWTNLKGLTTLSSMVCVASSTEEAIAFAYKFVRDQGQVPVSVETAIACIDSQMAEHLLIMAQDGVSYMPGAESTTIENITQK